MQPLPSCISPNYLPSQHLHNNLGPNSATRKKSMHILSLVLSVSPSLNPEP